MGNCCSGTSNEGEVTINKGNTTKMNDILFDDREILGLRGADKLALIVKVQALFKGAYARRKVK